MITPEETSAMIREAVRRQQARLAVKRAQITWALSPDKQRLLGDGWPSDKGREQ